MGIANVEDIYPQTPIQQAMFIESRRDTEAGLYLVQLIWTLRAGFNHVAFQQAWQLVVNRHSVLRTLFVKTRQGKPLQVMCESVKADWIELDWQGFSASEQELCLNDYLDGDRRRGFDLGKAPLARFTLIQIAGEEFRFIWSYHHLLLDRWSLSLVLQEVLAAYEAFCSGVSIQMRRPRPYAEYVSWLERQDLSEAEAFWRPVLKGFTVPTLARIGAYIAKGPAADAVDHTCLSESATGALQSQARRHGLTMSTLVQGAWALLMGWMCNEAQAVFGLVVSGRSVGIPGVESIVGPFLNVLPMRVRIAGDELLLPWLRELQNHQAEVCQYDYCPLPTIEQWSDMPAGTPLFHSIVDYVNYPVNVATGTLGRGLENTESRSIERAAFGLSLLAIPADELKLEVMYDCGWLEPAIVTQMLTHLRLLLEAFTGHWFKPLSVLLRDTLPARYQPNASTYGRSASV